MASFADGGIPSLHLRCSPSTVHQRVVRRWRYPLVAPPLQPYNSTPKPRANARFDRTGQRPLLQVTRWAHTYTGFTPDSHRIHTGFTPDSNRIYFSNRETESDICTTPPAPTTTTTNNNNNNNNNNKQQQPLHFRSPPPRRIRDSQTRASRHFSVDSHQIHFGFTPDSHRIQS